MSRRRLPAIAVALVAATALSCDGPARLVHPDTTGLELQVREQIDASRARFDTATGAARAEAAGRLAMLYQIYDFPAAAESAYLLALDGAGDTFSWWYYLAHARRVRGDLAGAAQAFERALEQRPDDAPALVHLGEVELERHRLADARVRFGQALEREPDCARALLGLGRCDRAAGDPAQAVHRLERARLLAPAAAEVRYPLGLAYRDLGRIDEAEVLLAAGGEDRVPLVDPLMEELALLGVGRWAYQARADALWARGRFAEAAEQYRLAVAADPTAAVAHTHLGLALSMLGSGAEAEVALREGVRWAPDDPFARFQLAMHRARQGDDARASEILREALGLDPLNARARFELANSLRRLGRFAEAAEVYAGVVEQLPAHAPSRLGEALSWIRLHEWRVALDRLERARTMLPEDLDLLAALVRLLAAAPDPHVRDGARAMELAPALSPGRTELDHLPALAMVAAENGLFAEAAEVQGRVVEAHRRAGNTERLEGLRAVRRLYLAGRPCRAPWPDDHPALSPPPLGSVEHAEDVE